MLMVLVTLIPVNSHARKLGWPGTDLKGVQCEGTPSNYGPFDYTNPIHRKTKLPIVEEYHFTPAIRLLMGKTAVTGSDVSNIAYTLRAFPNHHIALMSMMNAELILKQKISPPMMCYFNRAIAFKPTDYKVHMIKGIYLRRVHRYKLAEQAFQQAERLKPDSAELLYNIGLLYADMKRYKKAAEYARKAYAKGYPLQGLRKRLKKHGIKI